MDELKSWLPAIVPTVIFILLPLWHWLFSPRLARIEDVDAKIATERAAREEAIRGVTNATGELVKAVNALHTDHQVLKERLSALPTRDQVSALAEGQARIEGLLGGKLQQIDRVQDAVGQLNDIIADAARRAHHEGK